MALALGDEEALACQLKSVVGDSTSYHDMVSENSAHMLMLGLCYGVAGYEPPRSNLERGRGRFDIQLVPSGRPSSARIAGGKLPLITIEVKFLPKADVPADPETLSARLRSLAQAGLEQIAKRGYDAGPLPAHASGRLRWGIAFGGKSAECTYSWA